MNERIFRQPVPYEPHYRLFVVKVLSAGVRRAVESDVLASILSMQFRKFQGILKSFETSLNI